MPTSPFWACWESAPGGKEKNVPETSLSFLSDNLTLPLVRTWVPEMEDDVVSQAGDRKDSDYIGCQFPALLV